MITYRDEAVMIITSNLIMAGVLEEGEEAKQIETLAGYDDITLGLALVSSRSLLDMRYAKTAQAWRN